VKYRYVFSVGIWTAGMTYGWSLKIFFILLWSDIQCWYHAGPLLD